MKTKITNLLLVSGLLIAQMASAQGTLQVSNLNATPVGSAPIASDAWIAQLFRTGTNASGYNFNSAQLLMNPGSGSLSGFAVALYSSSTPGGTLGNPQSSLGILAGSDPAGGGTFTYTASGITLSASTWYFVLATAATPVAQGSYVWSAGPSFIVNGLDQWLLDDVYYSTTDGSSWTRHLREGEFQMALYATPVPEPAACALAGLGMVAFGFMRRGQRR